MCSLLLSKIYEAHGNIPVINGSSYALGRFVTASTDVSVGKYMGSSVAIKHLKMNDEDFDRMFKVRQENRVSIVTSCGNSGFGPAIGGAGEMEHISSDLLEYTGGKHKAT